MFRTLVALFYQMGGGVNKLYTLENKSNLKGLTTSSKVEACLHPAQGRIHVFHLVHTGLLTKQK